MKPTRIQAALHSCLMLAGVCAAGLAQAQTSYTFIDLGNGSAAGINDLGQVVGTSSLGATLWNSGTASGLTGGQGGAAAGINNLGQIVGSTSSNGISTAALWNNGKLTSLASPSGNSNAYGINNAGQIVGGYSSTTTEATGAILWQNGSASPLSVANGQTETAYAISGNGQIGGDSLVYYGNIQATLWKGSSTGTLQQPLTTDSFAVSVVHGINNDGIAVGYANTAPRSGDNYAVEWIGGKATQLGSLSTGATSEALAINNAGQVVGHTDYTVSSAGTTISNGATLWNGTTPTNLNNYLTPAERQAGWELLSATGINDYGSIVGDAYNTKTGANDAFELKVSPVPEPGEAGMMLAGLGLMAMFAWRRHGGQRKAGSMLLRVTA